MSLNLLEQQCFKFYNINSSVLFVFLISKGSTLAPMLFNHYMLLLGNVIRRYGIHFHSYADDIQLHIALFTGDTRPVNAVFNRYEVMDGRNLLIT